jgi:hypothetical protein
MLFDVIVQVEAVRHEILGTPPHLPEVLRAAWPGSSGVSELPKTVTLESVSIRQVSGDTYEACVRVSAENADSARLLGVAEVDDVLRVIALDQAAFRVSLGSGVSVVEAPPERAAARPLTRQDALRVEVRLTTKRLVAQRALTFQRAVLSKRPSWPPWLRTVLELNYLGILSNDLGARLVSHYSAIEVMVDGLDGPTKQLLPPRVRRRVTRSLNKELQASGVTSRDASRVIERAVTTRGEGSAQRLSRVLNQLGVRATEQQARLVTTARGAFSHAGATSSRTPLASAARLAEKWVRQGVAQVASRLRPTE